MEVDRDRMYELNGEDSRTLAAVGAFRVVPEHDLDADHDTLKHLRDEGLVADVDLGDDGRGLTLTREGRELLDAHAPERDDGASQRRAEARDRTADVERRVKSLHQKLDRVDEAFLYAESIDLPTESRAFWRSRSASCREPWICGCRRRGP